MIDNLIQALIEAVKEKDEAKIEDAKKLFVSTLYEIIDHRVDGALARRKSTSQERIAAADSINSSIKSTATTIRSLSALNYAPAPPDKNLSEQELKEWFMEYNEWYHTTREDAMQIK